MHPIPNPFTIKRIFLSLGILSILSALLACSPSEQQNTNIGTPPLTPTEIKPTSIPLTTLSEVIVLPTATPPISENIEQTATPFPISSLAPTEEKITPVSSPTEEKLIPIVTTTSVPLPNGTATCADIETYWGQDWPLTLKTLETLIATGQNCGLESLQRKKYAAHFTYAVSLENEQLTEQAIEQYRAALLTDPQRDEARKALLRLAALPDPTPIPDCPASLSPSDPAPTEAPNLAQFISIKEGYLQFEGKPFKIKGVNYYPRHAPWYRFIEQADMAEIRRELDVIQEAGFNTLRLFLRYEPLFICQPEKAIPNEAAFAKIDTIFQMAQERDLKLIVTLNDLPDLFFRSLYTDWEHYDAQTIYIVRRYRNEPHILAWDLRNEGDLDYGIRPNDEPLISQGEVIAWLGHISRLVRDNDPHHLLTAGWWGDPSVTAPYVDILSFHHWAGAEQLRARIENYQTSNRKPLLLEEVGYSTQQGETTTILKQVITVAETEEIAGWVIWTAFDFVPEPGQPSHMEHFFGLWQTDLSPKPVLEHLLPLEE